MLPGPQIMTGLRETDRLADTANLRRTTDGSRYGRLSPREGEFLNWAPAS